MKPRQATDAVLGTPTVVSKIGTNEYVEELIRYLERVHKFVQVEHKRVRESENELQRRKHGSDTHLNVGDYVFLKQPPKYEPGKSERFKHHTGQKLYQVYKIPGGDPSAARTYTLMDPTTGSTDLGFSQPVASERLTPVEVLPLSSPESVSTKLYIY